MKKTEGLKLIIDELTKLKVHPPLLEAAIEKFKSSLYYSNDEDLLPAIAEWAKTDDIKHYILAPINSGGGSKGGAIWVSGNNEQLPADWDLWAHILHCEYFKAVSLSLDLEPPKYPHEVRGWPKEYERRLKITMSHVEAKSLARSKTSINNVDMTVFSTWALSLGWDLPERFPKDSTELDVQLKRCERRDSNHIGDQNLQDSSEWTMTRLEELHKFHENERVYKKNRAFKKATAEKYGISTTRVSQLLEKYELIKPNSFGLSLHQLIKK